MDHPATTSRRSSSSRNRSPPTPLASSSNRRCSSPTVTKTATTSNVSVSNRAISTERRRSSPLSSTPRKDTAAEYNYRKGTTSNKLAESLWPSTMRNLSVSFQSDNNLLSAPVTTDRNRIIRPLCNATQKKNQLNETVPVLSLYRSPLKGKNELSENSRPVEIGVRKVSSMVLNRSPDFTDKASKKSSVSQLGSSIHSLRRLSLDNTCKSSQKPVENSVIVDRTFISSSVRSQSLGSSINKVSLSSSRGVSPLKSKTSSPVPSRGPSPSRSRTSSPLRQSNPTSVLSFIADIRKGKKAVSHIEDVHKLRILYNRHLQWRYANDQANVSQHLLIEKTERKLFNTWSTTSCLWKSVIEKRMKLLQMRLNLMLCSIINTQLMYLDVWESMEMDHTESLILAIKDLQYCTRRIPVIGGARGDIRTVKAAFCSAFGVLQAMGSSMSILLSQMDKMYCLVSEVADVVSKERAMFDECEALLGSTVAMQVDLTTFEPVQSGKPYLNWCIKPDGLNNDFFPFEPPPTRFP